MSTHREPVVELERRLGRPAGQVLDRLRAVHDERGALTAADVQAIADDLDLPAAHVHGAATFFSDLAFAHEAEGPPVRMCAGAACAAARGGGPREARAPDQRADDSGASGAAIQPVHCLGHCYASPAALVGETPCAGPDLADQIAGRTEPQAPPIPWEIATGEPVVLARLAGGEPAAWSVWRDVLDQGPDAGRSRVLHEVRQAGIRGRGGAGFLTAVKWTTAAESATDGPRYIVANGDEGDPGSYIDRLLMESDPHGVLEGMALAALAVGATHGFVYVRSEYPRARDALRAAVADARAAGDLGTDIHGAGLTFDVDVFEGAGSYVAGEETALIHSMEGLRGGVAPRPPYPATRGLFNRPTVVNNVETLASLPWIVARGGHAYAALGTDDSHGTKVVCLNERFARPGAYEVELGVPLQWICDELGGGLRDGRRMTALQVGGPLGGYLGPDELDVPLAFGALREAGVELGHGSLIAFDERTSSQAMLLHTWQFIAAESCGTCAPCRIGSRRGLDTARRLAGGQATPADLARHDAVLDTMAAGSLCAFGQTAPQPIRCLLRLFGDELAPKEAGA